MSQDDPNRAKVEIIMKEVGRLETILRLMLAYIQPLELQMSRTDPNQLVERALSSVDMEIKERNGYDTVDLPMTKILVLKHGGMVDVRMEGSGELTIHLSLPL